MAKFYADDPLGPRKAEAIDRFGEDAVGKLWACGITPWSVEVEWRPDDTIRRLVVRAVYGERGITNLLALPAAANLEVLALDDLATVPPAILARRSLHTVIVGGVDATLERLATRARLPAFDVTELLAIAPQLTGLAVAADWIELGDGAALARLQTLVVATRAWPLPERLVLPALAHFGIELAEDVPLAIARALPRTMPALQSLSVAGTGAASLFVVLPEALPPAVAKVSISGPISLAQARQLVTAPGRLADVAQLCCSSVDRRAQGWLGLLAGDALARTHKLADLGQRWVRRFAAATEPPSPAIVVEGAVAFWPRDPVERDLRGADPETALVYADWLEEHGWRDVARGLRASSWLPKNPLGAIHATDDQHRDSFRDAVFLLLDAWRQLAPAAPRGEPGERFRERIHAELQGRSLVRQWRKDGSVGRAIDAALSDELRATLGALQRSLELRPGILAGESAAGVVIVVTDPDALRPT